MDGVLGQYVELLDDSEYCIVLMNLEIGKIWRVLYKMLTPVLNGLFFVISDYGLIIRKKE